MKTIQATLATAWLTASLALAVPSEINYQGVLTDSQGNPLNGNQTMSLKIFDAATGGTLLYSENLGTVPVSNGVYNFTFGANGTSNALATETVATTNGTASTFQKVLSATTVVAGSVTVTDGTYTWDQSNGSSNENDFGVSYNSSLRRVTVNYYNGAPSAGKTISATYRTPTAGVSGSIANNNQQWLETAVNGAAQTPRQKILTVPYSYSSKIADDLSDTAKQSIIEQTREDLSSVYNLIAASLTGGVFGANKTNSPNSVTQLEFFNQVNGFYGKVLSTNSSSSSLGIDVGKKNELLNSSYANGFENPKTFQINDKVNFVQFASSYLTTTISYKFNYSDGTDQTVANNSFQGFFRIANPFPEKTVSSITRTAGSNNSGLVFNLLEFYQSLSPIEIVVELDEKTTGGNAFIIGCGAIEQGPKYSISYQLLTNSNTVLANSTNAFIETSVSDPVRRIKIIATPSIISSIDDAAILKGISITKLSP